MSLDGEGLVCTVYLPTSLISIPPYFFPPIVLSFLPRDPSSSPSFLSFTGLSALIPVLLSSPPFFLATARFSFHLSFFLQLPSSSFCQSFPFRQKFRR